MRKKKKINILYLIDYLTGFGGSERHLFQLATKLNKDRFSCMICPFASRPEILERFRENGIEINDIPIPRIYGFNAFLQSFKLKKIIQEQKIDIVQTFHFCADTYGVLLSKFLKVPHIISSRRDMGDLKPRVHKYVSKAFNRYIDRFIVVSDAVGAAFSNDERIPIKKINTIYNGVDLTEWDSIHQGEIEKVRAELKIDKDDCVVGYVAHFRPGKGHNVLFEALKRMKSMNKNLKILLVGGCRGNLMEHYRKFCEYHNLQDHVIFVGYTEDVRKYYSVFDVYCLASDNEGCSNSILEAMASGKPVIATAVGGNPEVVKNGENGILISPNDPESLMKAILKLEQRPDLRKKMGIKSRERIENELSLEKMIQKNEELYIQLYENGITGGNRN